jgi:transcription termination/antitermination protein NusG
MSIETLDGKWVALQVKPKAEKIVASILGGKGYEHFLPMYTRRPARIRRGDSPHPLPMFPGYVFCRYRCSTNGLMVTTPGVVRIVGIGRTPAPIDDQEISALFKIVEAGLPVEPCEFQRGDRVEIVSGPFQGVLGQVMSMRGEHRLVVSVELLQRSVSVNIDADCVQIHTFQAQSEPRTGLEHGGCRHLRNGRDVSRHAGSARGSQH